MVIYDASAHFVLGDQRIRKKLKIVYAAVESTLAGKSSPNAKSVEVKRPSPCMSRTKWHTGGVFNVVTVCEWVAKRIFTLLLVSATVPWSSC